MTDKELAAHIAKDIVVALITEKRTGIDHSLRKSEVSAISNNIEKTSELFSGIYTNVLHTLSSSNS